MRGGEVVMWEGAGDNMTSHCSRRHCGEVFFVAVSFVKIRLCVCVCVCVCVCDH